MGNFKTFSRPCFCVLQLCLHNPVLTQLTMVLALFWLPLTQYASEAPLEPSNKKERRRKCSKILWAFMSVYHIQYAGCVNCSPKIVCSGHFRAVSRATALYSGWAIFHLDEEEVQLFHILFPIVPGKQRFQEKDSISLPPPHATCWDKPVYLVVSFLGRGRDNGAPH